MITAVHTLVYSDDPQATRSFFKEVLQWGFVSEDGGEDPGDWLIFSTGRSELGVHPTSGDEDGGWTAPKHHAIAVMCDDLDATVADLAGRGAKFTADAEEMGFGRGIMHVPGADDMLLYQPHHTTAYDLA